MSMNATIQHRGQHLVQLSGDQLANGCTDCAAFQRVTLHRDGEQSYTAEHAGIRFLVHRTSRAEDWEAESVDEGGRPDYRFEFCGPRLDDVREFIASVTA